MSFKNKSVTENNDAFKIKIEDLINEILIDHGMPYYRIESKMEFTGGHDEHASHPVIRIITYFEDTVNKIADLLQTEFELDNVRSIKGARPENFSYKHVQYIAGLKADRKALTEYKRSADKKFEIQVCSMIQDAWVGIEKELGYDSASVPDEVKRDFYRVGALLEMADIEFLKIRSQIKNTTANNANAQAAQVTPVAEQVQPAAAEAPTAQAAPAAEMQAKEEAPAAPEQVHTHTVPVAVAAAAIPLAEQLKKTVEETTASHSIAQDALNLVNTNATQERLAVTPEEQHTAQAPVAPVAKQETTAPRSENTAWNTDSAPAFNPNVNGNKTQEPVREYSTPARPVPFYNEVPKPAALEPVDEHAPMTDAMLRDYVQNSRALKEVDMQIAERAGAKLNAEIDIEGDVDRLRFLKVNTLKQLHERIIDNSADIVAFAEKWIGKDNGGSFDSGICLFYLEYLLVGKKNDPAFAVEYVVKFISDNDYSARYIIPTYNSIRNAETATSHAHLTLK